MRSRSKSKSSELRAELRLDRSTKRFLLLPAERSRREARRLCSIEGILRARFWTSVSRLEGENAASKVMLILPSKSS